MTPLFRKFLGLNWLLFAAMLLLAAAGVCIIYSAVHFRTDDPTIMLYWRKQIMWGCVGLVAFFAASLVDYRWLRWGALPAYMAGVAGLAAVQVMGTEIDGNKSWIRLPGLGTVQPSQFAIAAGILMLAFTLGELHRLLPFFRHHFVRLGIAGLVTAVPLAFVLKEGDLGSAMVWGPVFLSMVFVGSIPLRYLIVIALVALMVAPWGYVFALKPHQRSRIDVPWKMLTGKPVDYQKEGYANINIVRAIGSGGFEGKGFDGSRMPVDPMTGKRKKTMHQVGWVPKRTAHNDYIFAVLAEQAGFRGVLFLIGGLALLVFQTVYIAFCSRDNVGRILVVGVAALLFAHTFENIGMQVQLTPITGIPLPFISYGGTFLVTVMFLMGMVQSVWVHRNVVIEEPSDKDKSPRQKPRPISAE